MQDALGNRRLSQLVRVEVLLVDQVLGHFNVTVLNCEMQHVHSLLVKLANVYLVLGELLDHRDVANHRCIVVTSHSFFIGSLQILLNRLTLLVAVDDIPDNMESTILARYVQYLIALVVWDLVYYVALLHDQVEYLKPVIKSAVVEGIPPHSVNRIEVLMPVLGQQLDHDLEAIDHSKMHWSQLLLANLDVDVLPLETVHVAKQLLIVVYDGLHHVELEVRERASQLVDQA